MQGRAAKDLTVLAIPVYFGSMAAEYLWLRSHAQERGPTPGDYERRDTVASLAMGVGSLAAPLVMPKLLGPLTPGKGRFGKVLVATAAGAVALTTAADLIARHDEATGDGPVEVGETTVVRAGDTAPMTSGEAQAGEAQAGESRAGRRQRALLARRVASTGGVVAIVAGGVAATTTWASRTTADSLRSRRVAGRSGSGPLALAAAVLGWDFIYYWNHRFMHESRFLWAIHVVHHSSERYNLSTALRQPVADAFGTFVPYSALTLLGIEPALVATARGVNLLYQFWIHTDTIRRLGPFEKVFNTPSHHRVHHGSNRQYLDRNHGSILILWDRLFGTFEPEGEPVVYGLTKNIDTFNPVRIAGREHTDMLRDVAASRSWRDRLSFVLRGPGWAYRRRAEMAAAPARASAVRPTTMTSKAHPFVESRLASAGELRSR